MCFLGDSLNFRRLFSSPLTAEDSLRSSSHEVQPLTTRVSRNPRHLPVAQSKHPELYHCGPEGESEIKPEWACTSPREAHLHLPQGTHAPHHRPHPRRASLSNKNDQKTRKRTRSDKHVQDLIRLQAECHNP